MSDDGPGDQSQDDQPTGDQLQDDRLWDYGAQPERTALAWRRTMIGLAGAGFFVPRLWWTRFGWWGVLPSAALIVAAGVVWWGSHQRYRRAHGGLVETSELVTGGTLLLVPILGCTVLGVAALAALR